MCSTLPREKIKSREKPRRSKMNSKLFERRLYNDADPISKKAAANFFEDFNYEVLDINKESYSDFDIQIKKDDRVINIEIERSYTWRSGEFPYSYCSIPARKSGTKADFYIYFRHDLRKMKLFQVKDIKASPFMFKDTRNTKNEQFFNVSLSHSHNYEIYEDGWTDI
jgi:hypothetical protein